MYPSRISLKESFLFGDSTPKKTISGQVVPGRQIKHVVHGCCWSMEGGFSAIDFFPDLPSSEARRQSRHSKLVHGRWPTLIFRETRHYLHCFPHCRKTPILGSAHKNCPRVHLPTCPFVLLTSSTRAPIFADCQDFWHRVMAMTVMTW